MRNARVGARLALGFAVILLLLAGVTGLGVAQLATLNGGTRTIVDGRYPKIDISQQAMNEMNVIEASLRNALLQQDAEQVNAELKRVEDAQKRMDEHLAKLEAMMTEGREPELFRAIREARGKYAAQEREITRLARAYNSAEATSVLFNAYRRDQGAFVQALGNAVAYNRGLMNEAGRSAESIFRSAVYWMLALAIAAGLTACGVGWTVARGITRPLQQAVLVAQNVARGDLRSRIDVARQDETGLLLEALKDMNGSLERIVAEVRSGTDAIGTASTQIAAGNADLAHRTEEQASSLEQTASSMEQLTSTVKQNAENARQANQLAGGASAVALRGGEVVGEVVRTMSSINESSQRIAEITGVIDGIAFQTNILALNAAVEAARAGEQGRGFAVVASEVRSLAQRSAAAAKEIKALITDSVGKVEEGTRLVDEAGKTMNEIVTSVKRVTDIMAEISAASQEQSSGIEQVNQAVTQMDEATQQNAALVEEATAAAESLQEQAGGLAQAVAVFKLARSEAACAASAAPEADRAVTKLSKPVVALPRREGPRAGAPQAETGKTKKIANAKAGQDDWEAF